MDFRNGKSGYSWAEIGNATGTRKMADHISSVTSDRPSSPRESHAPRCRDCLFVLQRGGCSWPRKGNFSVRAAGSAHQARRKKAEAINAKVMASPGPTLHTKRAAK